ncbi:membrane protein [Salmonella enterica subsp. enterica]|uniref:Membrane protein n=1 Tax=Salmonella enterica I TaxID=59201 RepID=A0A3S4IPT8_SALET|nr:membrane protein [Salmonella enterica subsp. enterica]
MTLFAEYNSPYLFAIAFVFFIGVLEMISLIFWPLSFRRARRPSRSL